MELGKAQVLQLAEDLGHVLAHRQRLALHLVVLHQPRPTQHFGPGGPQVVGRDIRQADLGGVVQVHLGAHEVAAHHRQRVDLCRPVLDALVFQQPPGQLGAGVFHLLVAVGLLHRQQHP